MTKKELNGSTKLKEKYIEWTRETLSDLFSPNQGVQTPSVLLSQFHMSDIEK